MLKTVWLVGLCLYGALDAERQAWTKPDERLRSVPLLPALRADEFGPDSHYRLLLAAGDIPDSCIEAVGSQWSSRDRRFPDLSRPQAARPPWNARTCGQMREVLAALEPHLALARRAAAMPDGRLPSAFPFSEMDPAPARARTSYRALAFSAYCKEGQHDYPGTPANARRDAIAPSASPLFS